MRKVITYYVACDGEEFNSIERCREHEQKCLNTLREIKETYTFYDAAGNVIQIADYDAEALIDDLEAACKECEKIAVRHDVSYTAAKLLYNISGIVLPDDAGIYKYDFDHWTWESVSE